ncbi:MAG: hypothetical protein ACXADC_05325 [Candidatus Thorarchaeota archaeon]|jgi:hypothetical protein
MKRHWKLLLLAVVFVSLIAVMPADTQAAYYDYHDDDGLVIIIDEAYYADYDNDGKEDDVVTVFSVILNDDDGNNGQDVVIVFCKLELPSGTEFDFVFEEKTKSGFQATLVWYNTAIESGWYDFSVKAKCGWNEGSDKIIFDPPGKGGGEPPVIAIAMIVQL